MRKPETFARIRQRFVAILHAEYWFSLHKFSLLLQTTEQGSNPGEDWYRVACIDFMTIEGNPVIFQINVFYMKTGTLGSSNAGLAEEK